MRSFIVLLFFALPVFAQKIDYSFLKSLSPKAQIQKIIDTTDYINNKDPRKALEMINYGFELLKENPDQILERDMYYVQAWAYMELSDYEKATELIEKSNSLNNKPNDYDYLSNYHTLTANIAIYQSNLSKAIDHYYVNLGIAEKSGNKRDLGVALGNLGNMYSQLNLNDKALKYYDKALGYFRELNDLPSIAIFYDNIGLILSEQKKYKEALKYFWDANKLYKEVGNTINYYWNFAYLGDTYFKLGDIKNALHYLDIAYDGSKRYNHSLGIIESCVNLGNLYFAENNYDKSLKYLMEAEPLAKTHRIYSFLTNIYLKASMIYEKKGDFKKAYYFHTQYTLCYDSVYTADVQKKLKETELRYNISKKENELALVKKDKRLNELELKRANTTRNYLIAIFIIASIFAGLYFILKQRSIKKLKEKQDIINEQKEELEKTNKELLEYQSDLQNLNRNLEIKVAEEVAKREAQQIKVMQKSKLESLGIFSAGIAHEINQPLTSISFSVENMIYKKQTGNLTDEYLETKFGNIVEDIKRITNIITHIRIFAREQGNVQVDCCDINEVVSNSQLIVNTQLKNKNININILLSDTPVIILGNKYKLEQVLLNLIVNARYAVDKKDSLFNANINYQKRITIRTALENDNAVLSVEDNGIGIPKEIIQNVFEPFFTTKDPEDGSGMGLSISYGIIKEHNGQIEVESAENEFTRFTIKIPAIS
jgi:two-component system, NtrC family, sensor kinase